MLVSFIIPAYNAADTIVRCLESIYGLSLKREEFEVIVIDDASSDNTIEVIELYCQKGKREEVRGKSENLILLKQPENHRQGAARNRGVKAAKGEYICFVDADDAVTAGIVQAIWLANEKKSDMVALHNGNVNEFGETTLEIQPLKDFVGKVFTGIEMQNAYPYWCSAPWGYIYSKAFLDRVNYSFAEDVLFEDSDFVAVHLYHAKQMIYSPELGYKAYYREGSTTHHTSYKNIADYLLLGVRMKDFYERIVNSQDGTEPVDSRGIEQFAEGILEGACWNVQKSCKRIIKLGGLEEVKAYYERVDTYVNRKALYAEKNFHRYYWNVWTSLCVGHKKIAFMLFTVMTPIYRLVKKK